ncbi:MAG: sugar transferase [Patescibacteria group bacterium]
MYPKIKRLMDIAISSTALLLFFPFAAILMLMIFIEDKASPIYRQPRVGRHRKLFSFYKFRSMVKNADELLFSNPSFLERLRSGNHKMKDDPRITRIGKFIRKFSIDEFPQFINVLMGDMSFVGPRPFRPDELEKYEKSGKVLKDAVDKILSVKPGITGLWQTGGRSELSFDDRINIELKYATHCSLMLDLYIIFKTPIAVFQAKGAL